MAATPTLPSELVRDMLVALVTLKYTQSNSVCFVLDGRVIGNSAGRQSGIHCVRIAPATPGPDTLPASMRVPSGRSPIEISVSPYRFHSRTSPARPDAVMLSCPTSMSTLPLTCSRAQQ